MDEIGISESDFVSRMYQIGGDIRINDGFGGASLKVPSIKSDCPSVKKPYDLETRIGQVMDTYCDFLYSDANKCISIVDALINKDKELSKEFSENQ